MKTLIPISALAALFAAGSASAQTPAYSKPSGYTTQVLRPNTTNYVGINLLTPIAASGSVTGFENNRLRIVDSKARLTQALQSGKMHTIEITSGAAVGHVREFSSWWDQRVNLSLAINGLNVGDKYIIRRNPTLQQIFPNGAPLTGGDTNAASADIVRVPNGSGGWDQYFYKTTDNQAPRGWWTTPDRVNRGTRVTVDIPLLYTDGIQIVRRAGVNQDLVLTGQVKTNSSIPYLIQGDNPVSINAPAGANLANSRLSSVLQGHATSPATADVLFVPQSNGTLVRYWFKNSSTGGAVGWYRTPDGIAPGTLVTGSTVWLPPYCLIKRKGSARFAKIEVPPHYSNL